jgi:hypothetical protein
VNIFNRIVMIIAMLCIIALSIAGIVNIFLNLFEWSTVSDRIANYLTNMNQYILLAVLFLALVIALIILIFEFYRRKVKLANVYSDSSGNAMVTLKTSSTQIKESLLNVQDIIDPKVKVVPKQNGVVINIFSKLASGVNVANKTKEIREAAIDFASKNLGFKVIQTNYTATGFVTKRAKEIKPAPEEAPKEVEKEEQTEENIE